MIHVDIKKIVPAENEEVFVLFYWFDFFRFPSVRRDLPDFKNQPKKSKQNVENPSKIMENP